METFKKILGFIGDHAPLLASAATNPAGAAIALVAEAFGGDPKKPDDLLARLTTDPKAAEKLREIQAQARPELAKIAMQREANQLAAETASDNARQQTIRTEGGSEDKYTSRARPTFLYVMYVWILAAIPMGILFYLKPDVAGAVINGMAAWLNAMPDQLWWLFGAGFLGYTGARSWDKRGKFKAAMAKWTA